MGRGVLVELGAGFLAGECSKGVEEAVDRVGGVGVEVDASGG